MLLAHLVGQRLVLPTAAVPGGAGAGAAQRELRPATRKPEAWQAVADSDDDGLIAGINVTPLVDVTLVLLIIFMVTAKIIVSQGMPMDLPKAASGEAGPDRLLGRAVRPTARRASTPKSSPATRRSAPLAKTARAKNKDLRAVIRADKKVEHGRVIHVLDLLEASRRRQDRVRGRARPSRRRRGR